MNKAYIIGAFILVASFFAGYSVKRCEDCSKQFELMTDSLERTQFLRDSLSIQLEILKDNMTPITNDPDTIERIVVRRHRLQRIAGVDSSEQILFSNPQ